MSLVLVAEMSLVLVAEMRLVLGLGMGDTEEYTNYISSY